MLLKPWCNLETDLKGPNQSWEDAFDEYMASPQAARKGYQWLLSGIQYYHNSESSAYQNHRGQETLAQGPHEHEEHMFDDKDANPNDTTLMDEDSLYSPAALASAITSQESLNEALHGV